jgi:3-oxoacyl-[acyl-carrier protein] reductase
VLTDIPDSFGREHGRTDDHIPSSTDMLGASEQLQIATDLLAKCVAGKLPIEPRQLGIQCAGLQFRFSRRKEVSAMANKKLAGKVAVVTGASKGIGAAVAKYLAVDGASVVVNYASSKDSADQVVDEIVKEGGKAIAVQGDVAKKKDIEHLFAETKKAFGRLDILVNNAGVYTFAPLEEAREDEFHRLFNINVFGLILATREALKYFGAEGGSVINIGSTASSITPPTTVVYTATKGAVDAITRVLAKELGPRKIRVNSINPGTVETEGYHTLGMPGSDFEKQAIAQTPLGRIGQPRDIAPVVAFLASSDSAWITGEILHVAGGLS